MTDSMTCMLYGDVESKCLVHLACSLLTVDIQIMTMVSVAIVYDWLLRRSATKYFVSHVVLVILQTPHSISSK